jgi:hypothetical protein
MLENDPTLKEKNVQVKVYERIRKIMKMKAATSVNQVTTNLQQSRAATKVH